MTIALDGRRRHLALIEISSPSHLASPSPFLPKATIGNSMTTRFFSGHCSVVIRAFELAVSLVP
jgi:hypothetical protein